MFPNGEVYTPTDTVRGVFNTFDPADGTAITLAGTPSLRLERNRSGTWSEITGDGITLSVDEDDTGRHEYAIDLDDANIGAAAGDIYRVALNAGTVDGNSVVGFPVGYFHVLADGLTTQQKADVNTEADTALTDYDAVVPADLPANFGSLGIESDGDLTKVNTLDGHTAQTGDSFARLGAPAGASVSADLATVDANVDTLLTRITSTLFDGITSLAEWLGLLAGKQTADATARTEIRATGAGSGTFDETSDSLEAIRDTEPLGTAIVEAVGSAPEVQALLTQRSIPEKGSAFTFAFKMVDATDLKTGETGLSVTAQVSKDGAAFGAAAGTPTEIGNGWYEMPATAADMNADRLVFRFTASGAHPTEIEIFTDGGV